MFVPRVSWPYHQQACPGAGEGTARTAQTHRHPQAQQMGHSGNEKDRVWQSRKALGRNNPLLFCLLKFSLDRCRFVFKTHERHDVLARTLADHFLDLSEPCQKVISFDQPSLL